MTAKQVTRPLVLGAALFAAIGGSTAGCGSRPGVAPAVPPTPKRFTYGPFTARYEATSHGRVEQEFNGQVTTNDLHMRFYVTVEVGDSGDNAPIALTLDSIPRFDGPGVTPGGAAEVAGTTFHGLLSSEGEIREFHGGDTTLALTQQLGTRLRRFFPHLPPDGVSSGETWTDTTETTTTSSGLEILVQAVARKEAIGWTTYAGTRALHVTAVSNYTLSGGGSQGGQEISLDGAGIRHEHHYLAADGRYLGGTAADTATTTAMLTAMGVMIPILQQRVDTLSVLR